MKRTLFLTIFAALATAGVTVAQYTPKGKEPGQHKVRIFEELDANSDGKITREEMRAHEIERWRKADANKDGRVTPEEIAQLHKERAAEHYARMDRNGDGVLSRDEVPGRLGQRFEELDENRDGVLSQTEIEKGRPGSRHGGKPCQWRQNSGGTIPDQAEVEARADERFNRLDANRDGVIVPEEMNNGRHHWGFRPGHPEE